MLACMPPQRGILEIRLCNCVLVAMLAPQRALGSAVSSSRAVIHRFPAAPGKYRLHTKRKYIYIYIYILCILPLWVARCHATLGKSFREMIKYLRFPTHLTASIMSTWAHFVERAASADEPINMYVLQNTWFTIE